MLWNHRGARQGTCDTCCGVMGERAAGHGSAQEAVRAFSKLWGRFFICDKDFVDYNLDGMRAEDPTAHKWSASKLWIDYTPFVKALDWTEALQERCMQDEQNLGHLVRERKKDQSTSPWTTRCTCGRSGGTCSCQSDDNNKNEPLAILARAWVQSCIGIP
jgi:hypothetical protein